MSSFVKGSDDDFRGDFHVASVGRAVVTMKYNGFLSATIEGLEGDMSGGFSSAR